MEIYPAVDIRGGRVAHLRSEARNAERTSVYGDDPAAAVARLFAEGARWVHVVDLDYAYGVGSNRDMLNELLASFPSRLQVGGSLRSEALIEEILSRGAGRAVIGCAAAGGEPALVDRLVRRHGTERLAAAIDVAGGRIRPRGIPVSIDLEPRDLVARVHGAGLTTVLYTNVERDGSLAGPDIDGASTMRSIGPAVILSGGIGSLEHVLAAHRASLAGVIIGRALHEGRFALREALACAAA